jgi:hypothetical protein
MIQTMIRIMKIPPSLMPTFMVLVGDSLVKILEKKPELVFLDLENAIV